MAIQQSWIQMLPRVPAETGSNIEQNTHGTDNATRPASPPISGHNSLLTSRWLFFYCLNTNCQMPADIFTIPLSFPVFSHHRDVWNPIFCSFSLIFIFIFRLYPNGFSHHVSFTLHIHGALLPYMVLSCHKENKKNDMSFLTYVCYLFY